MSTPSSLLPDAQGPEGPEGPERKLTPEEVFRVENYYLKIQNLHLQTQLLEAQKQQAYATLQQLQKELEAFRRELSDRYGVEIGRQSVRPDGTIVTPGASAPAQAT